MNSTTSSTEESYSYCSNISKGEEVINPSIDDIREKSLKIIFNAYARSSPGHASTFDEI